MQGMPTRDECRALGAKTATTAASSSSSGRAEENHQKVMKAIRGVKHAVQIMNDTVIQQLQNTEDCADMQPIGSPTIT